MTKAQLQHGKALMELLKQPLCNPLSLHEQVETLCMANHGVFDKVETKNVKQYQNEILELYGFEASGNRQGNRRNQSAFR